MIYVNEKDLVVPGELLAEDDYYSGRGTFEEDGKICSKLLGLVSLRNKKISVIPLKSKYLPKKGDVVIGKIDDVRFSMWGVDINSPYSGILPASEVFGREKKELSRVFDIGDVLFLRIVDVDEVKKVKLGLKGRGMGKFKGGVIVDIAPTKVPRLIGKKGSMINMIKDKTGCKIVVGQNGLVWVKGNEDMEQIVKKKEAHTSGLTDRIKNKLCLLIDGELPPEEEEAEQVEEYEEDAFEEGLKKPELQDFRDEVEKELAEELANEDSEDEDDFEDFDDDLDDDSDEDEEDLEDFNDDSEDEEGFEDFDDDLDDDSEEDEEDSDDFEDFDDDLDDDSEEDSEEDSDDDLDDDSEEEIEEFDEDISDEQLEDVINEAISEDEDSSEDADLVEDEENDDLEASEEDADEDSEDKEEEAKEDSEEEKEEKSKKPKFLDTFEYINEQKKKNKSSFDFSRADNSKSPTLNISQGRGI